MLFLDFQRIWPRFVQTITSSRQKKKKKEKLVSLSAHYYKMFCLHFSNMVAQKMTSRTQASGKKKTRISTGREEAEKFQLFPD